jgi:hypothetical protein
VDFNGDGILDTLRLDATRPRATQLSLELSGHSPQHLIALEDQLISIATADIDRDGRDDVVATSRHRGLVFWRNLGNGRFARHEHLKVHRHPSIPRLVAQHGVGSTDDPPETRAVDDITHADATVLIDVFHAPVRFVSRLLTDTCPFSSRLIDRARPSRAPPA